VRERRSERVQQHEEPDADCWTQHGHQHQHHE
jgi:hypothetical protein